MTFSGDLKGIQLADVFQNINGNRLTGTIQVSTRQGDRYVYFRDGMVAGYSRGVNKGLPVGDHLVQRGYVEHAALSAALKKKAKNRKLLRVVLAEQNLLTEDEFRGALAELMGESLYDLLMLKEASFNFTEGDPLPRVFDTEQKASDVSLDPSGILMESARRMDEWDRIHRVILSDRDLFVVLEGYEEAGLDDLSLRVAEYLDGRTDIQTILQELPFSRFDILKSISDMVMQGHARPLSVSEIDQMAKDAMADGDAEGAVTLLNRALMIERSNKELRLELIELFEQMDRKAEAASELALLGYQQAQVGEVDEALVLYARATNLNPNDLMLHERRVDLLREAGREDEFVAATLEFVNLLLTMGLADRARNTIKKAMEVGSLKNNCDLLQQLAEVEAHLGHGNAAGEIFLQLANQLPKKDEEGRLVFLKRAADYRPEDTALRSRIEDMLSGQLRLRRARRRRLISWAAGLFTLMGLGTARVIEITASHQVMGVLEGSLPEITSGHPSAALKRLDEVQKRFGWTSAGRRAEQLAKRLLSLELDQLEQQLRVGEYEAALAGLQHLRKEVNRKDVQARLKALIRRAQLELHAKGLCDQLAANPGDTRAREALAKMADPQLLDFILAKLEKPSTADHIRRPLLQALTAIDSPRGVLVAARLYLDGHDRHVNELVRQILLGARHHRDKGRARSWSEIYPELENLLKDDVKGDRARDLLKWLRGDG